MTASLAFTLTAQEENLVKRLQQMTLSVSHDLDHLLTVARYAAQLAELYQARREIVVPAALLHDLGRHDVTLKGKASAEEGARLAAPLLEAVGYESADITATVQCIAEHDQPEFQSQLLESRILKEADFLDGFGARGLLRSLLYAGETGGGVSEAIERIRFKSRRRLDSLTFVESKRLAWRWHRLAEVFLDELQASASADVGAMSYPGKLIIFEGLSGSGKDTQAALLVKHFQAQQKIAHLVSHPTPFFKEKVWPVWRSEVDDRASEAFLMLAERVRMVKTVIKPALERGEIVIGTRSAISAQVYQANEWVSNAFYRLAFAFEPVADAIMYLDVTPEEAWARANQRVLAGQEKTRGFFGDKQLQQQERYTQVLATYPNVCIISASGTPQEVHHKVVSCVEAKL